jgi:glutamine---fructose-6-phosphate transaminase (isomerizing)
VRGARLARGVCADLARAVYASRAVPEALLARELAEQPAAVARVLSEQREAVAHAALAARAADARAVLIAARGTSDNVARYAQHVLGRYCGLPVALATPSLTTLYGATPRLERTLVLGISQSGQSPDVTAVVEAASAQGAPTLAITNDRRSPLASAADVAIDIGVGAERSVAATKTYTASLAVIAALAVELSGDAALAAELAAIAAAMREQLALGTSSAAEALIDADRCAVAGRGPNYATAFEAALKIKELSGIAAEPYSSADLMHGPVAVLGPRAPLIAIGVRGPALESVAGAALEARERGATCIALTDEPRAFPHARLVRLVAVAEWLSPLVAILPAQSLAAQLARARGVTVDEPFGLSKVTRTV